MLVASMEPRPYASLLLASHEVGRTGAAWWRQSQIVSRAHARKYGSVCLERLSLRSCQLALWVSTLLGNCADLLRTPFPHLHDFLFLARFRAWNYFDIYRSFAV